jgi:PPOX class probable FMN-dependent enzyme
VTGFGERIESEAGLRELIPPPEPPAVHKAIDHLDAHCRDYIARSPFLVMASSDADGRCDASPKGGPPGFVHVLDDRRLAIPDYPGNRRLDSHTNILESGGVELLFLIPGMGETLRVRGRACLTRDPEVLAALDDAGKPPKLAIGVEVERAFLQCAKSLRRSRLWDPESWPEREELPRGARIFADHIALPGITEAAAAAHLEQDYETHLWPR